MPHLTTIHGYLLFSSLLLAPSGFQAGDGDGPTWKVSLKPEEAGGYPGNPSTLAAPLRQDLTALTLDRISEERYDLRLGSGTDLALSEVDLALLVPRAPSYARHDDALLGFALLQREFNRNEVKFGPQGDVADFKVANNCLRTGLWEIMLDKKVESGNAMAFHGWFDFPREEYAAIFQRLNGRPFAECERLLARYPEISGMAAPLAALREVKGERAVAVRALADEAPIRFGEQKRKAKLLLGADIATYADFTRPERQPIRTARFSEPGFYDSKNPVQFDLSWLARPTTAVRREVVTKVGAHPAGEVEIRFANGYALLVADRDLTQLPARTAAPENDKDTLRMTFGIGTPDIYATLAEREQEARDERAGWLFLLGKDGKHVDNHQAGVDRVFAWNEGGRTLHLYLVGYERIAVVGHLALDVAQQ